MGTSPAVSVLLLPLFSPSLSPGWPSAPLPSAFRRLSHLGVTSTSPLKANSLHPATAGSADQMCDSSIETAWASACAVWPVLLACRANTSRQIAPVAGCGLVPPHNLPSWLFFPPTRRRCTQQCLPRPGHHVYVITMYDDGMRRVSASCENGRDESDAALDRRPIGLQVGLRDLQRRLHRFLIRAQAENRNGTAMRISNMMVEGQRARGVQRGQSKCSAHRGGGGERQGNSSPMQPWEPSERGMAGPNRHLSCELETPSPTFLETEGCQTNQSTLSPCLTMRPQKISLAGTGAVAPGSRS